MKKLISAAAAAACLAIPSAAAANGPCGQNFDGNHACGVNSPAAIDGSLVTDNERDYYVFHAVKGTQVAISITDTENPACTSASSGGCGDVRVQLADSQGNDIVDSNNSYPNNGITVPATINHTLDAKGTYYLIVTGSLGYDANNNRTAIPYTLSVNASPNVQWPAPAPYTVSHCTVKHVWRRLHHHRVRVKITTCHKVTIYP